MNLFIFVLLFLAGVQAPVTRAQAIQGRWTIDVAAAVKAMHDSDSYKSADAAGRARIDQSLSTVLPALTIDITPGELRGVNGTQHYVVKSEDATSVLLHLAEPPPGGDIRFDFVDSNTVRLTEGNTDQLPLLLHRDEAYARRQTMRPSDEQRKAWVASMRGTWSVDILTPIAEAMRRSPEYQRASKEERETQEKLYRVLQASDEADLVTFDGDTMRGVSREGKAARGDVHYELTAIDGNVAWANTVEPQDVRDEWKFERLSDGSVRVSDRNTTMFYLRPVKK